ncbi:hypothetical protein U9M48_034354 [Paspalum notatum var. saurae]|uniref:Uncharacterized protein n=1 Tax=Paspalum notatum var. saurae TaxID=547442 RepID=A0AAQ3U9K2_PASNO
MLLCSPSRRGPVFLKQERIRLSSHEYLVVLPRDLYKDSLEAVLTDATKTVEDGGRRRARWRGGSSV